MEGQELTEEAQMLVNQGISVRVAQRIAEIFTSGVLSPEELDDRAFDALRNFNEDAALEVLEKFSKSDLSHVQNKSAFLCGVMKTHMEKTRLAAETGEGTVSDVACSADEAKIRELLERTGYTLDITTGQRKYGGPPPSWEGPAPGTGSEKVCSQVFVGKIPRDCFEDELIPLLEECGQIYDFRLMMDPMSGNNRGYGFCTYAAKSQALAAVKNLDNKEIRPGKRLGVCISVANNRLFVGSIPKSKSKHEILEEFQKVTADLVDVIVYLSPDQKGKNRGFAFLEFESHKAAALARRRLSAGKIKVWGTISPTVDWAEPQEEPDEEVMSKVKVVYVRNLSPNITEEQLQEHFGQYGTLERVKKLKDYAFIHFTEREQCIKAIEELNGKPMDGIPIEASLAKPQPAKKDRRYGQQGFGGGMSRGRARGRGGPRGRGRGGYDQYGGDSYGYGGDGYGGYGGGGYGYGGDYSEGYDEGYSGGYDYGGGYGGGYQRGGRGGRPFRGGAPTRGPRGGRGGPRGGSDAGGYGRGGMRGYGGGFRGGNRGGRGGNRGGPRGRGAPFKRKYDDGQGSAGYPESKRQFKSPEQPIQQYGQQPQQQQPQQQYSQTQTWGNEPINQQPLYSTGQDYSTYDYSNTSQVSQQWYQDSYGQ